MDKLKYIKLENEDGSYSDSIPIGAEASNVLMNNGKSVQSIIGDINVDRDGSIAEQIETLYTDVDNLEAKDTDLENNIIDLQVNKINKTDIIDNLNSSSNTKVLSAKQGKVLGDAVTALEAENVKKKPYYFNTVADMKAATYLKVGDMAITLGNNTYNDGKGTFYKIRTITSEDIVDNDNIIALTISNTLIAEKISNYYINKNTSDINNINNNINNKEKGLIAISRNTENNKHYIYYSEDGENFKRVGNLLNLTEDSSALILINGTYYYFGNNSYYYSDDLVTWSNGIMINDNGGRENWAFYPFYDYINDKYYVFSALQYKNDKFINDLNYNTLYFKIIKQEFTINNDKTLNFDAPTNVKYVENESYIDPTICYDSIYGYTLAIKNEKTCKIELYSSNDINNFNESYAYLDGAGSEAPQLIDEDGFITMYCHDYALNSAYATGLTGDMGETYSKVIVANPNVKYNTANLTRHACKMPEIFRHAGIMKCDNKTLNLITSIGIKETPLYICNDYSIIGDLLKQTFCVTGGATYNLPNLPYGLFILGGGSSIQQININVKKYYDTPLKLFLGPTNIKFGGDTTNTNTVTTDALYNDGIMIECPVLPNKFINLPYKW